MYAVPLPIALLFFDFPRARYAKSAISHIRSYGADASQTAPKTTRLSVSTTEQFSMTLIRA
jgi:hypothetical protein